MTPSSSLISKLTNTILDSKIEDETERPRTYPSNPRSPILQRPEIFNFKILDFGYSRRRRIYGERER